jgi:hypothetical protein
MRLFVVFLFVIHSLIILGCNEGSSDGSSHSRTSGIPCLYTTQGRQDFLNESCDALVNRDFVKSCNPEQGEEFEHDCAYLCDSDSQKQPKPGCVTPKTEDPPSDLIALFESIEFIGSDAVNENVSEGTITWGDESIDGSPYLEIDLDEGDYRILSGKIPSMIEPDDDKMPDDYYEEDIEKYLELMGVDPTQIDLISSHISVTTASNNGGQASTKESNKITYVHRIVNGIRVETDRLIFSHDQLDGSLLSIKGRWHPVNYAESQFELVHSSMDELIDDIIDQFTENDWNQPKNGSITIAFAYRVEPSRQDFVLDLGINVRVNNSIYFVDI